MRIVLTSAHCWPAVRRGGERYVHELGAALQRAGHGVRVLSTGGPPRRDTVLGVPLQRLPSRHVPRRWYRGASEDLSVEAAFGAQAFAHLAGSLVAGHIDVWHASTTGDGAAAAIAGHLRARARTVFTDHGFPAARSRDRRPDRRLHRVVVDHVDDYVCVSRAAASYLEADFHRTPHVVPPGVRLADHHPADARAPRPVLLYAGSLVESRKGLPLLLEAAARLLAAGVDLELWLLGPGDPKATLADAPVAARTAVTKCHLADDVELKDAYARAWVTVLPSQAESFGMTLVESLACGTPVVALADGGGPAEIVTDPAVGRLAGPGPDALATACAEVLELSRDPATAAACREHARRWDWDSAVVPALERIYRGDAA